MLRKLLLIPFILFYSNAYAVLKIDITQGNVDPMPIAVNNFYSTNGGEDSLGTQIKEIIEKDLKSSGIFRPLESNSFLETLTIDKVPTHVSWRQLGALAVTSGKITKNGDKITIEFRLWDPNTEAQIEGSALTMPEKAWRRAGHKISDIIYKRLTGEQGYFDTRLLFISESGPLKKRIKKLAIMDQDGANYMDLTDGNHLVLTPRFDPKSQRAIYMSYKNRTPQVFLLDIGTGNQRLIGNFPGMSFSPRFLLKETTQLCP